MKGDFSRISFDAAHHFSRVLSQQGRVTLDADFNEQADILLHLLRTLTRDLYGQHGGPADGSGFALSFGPAAPGEPPPTRNLRLQIGRGHYYVDGILCEAVDCDYAGQPDYAPSAPDRSGAGGDALLAWLKSPQEGQAFFVYLDVWERHVTWIEQASIREVALGSSAPDTCTRSKVVWQVRTLPWNADWGAPDCKNVPQALLAPSSARLAAQLSPGPAITDPCSIAPDARYRGAGNQLYRVEIHHGGVMGGADTPTFKWSRDNGSVATRWLGTEGKDLIVANIRGFSPGCWVELTDDRHDLDGEPGVLVKLVTVHGSRLTFDASVVDPSRLAWSEAYRNAKVRRWDQSENDVTDLEDGAVPVVESADPANPSWLSLEDGIEVYFAAGKTYRSGDYWLIPARVATGGIDWQADAQGSLLKPPRGIAHHYAPLGVINWSAGSDLQKSLRSCRNCFALTAGACSDAAPGPGGISPSGHPAPDAAPARPRTPRPGRPGRNRGPAPHNP